jgi:predicted extracellular nuclease
MKAKSSLLFLAIISNLFFSLHAQTNQIKIAFYNMENLFDTIDTPDKKDEEYLPSAKINWNTEKYLNKLANMSQSILAINNGKGPEVLGMCEVETEIALKDLCKELAKSGQAYQYVFHEGQDERGIDVAFIYKASSFNLKSSHSYIIDPASIGGDHTRNILLGSLTTKKGESLHVIVNHFPSRREGQTESEFKRIAVASKLKNICDSIHTASHHANIVIMGDFNDHPNDKSMAETLSGKQSIEETSVKDFYNPFWKLHVNGIGSHKYRGEWGVLDQILLSENLIKSKKGLRYADNSAKVIKNDFLLETEEKYKGNPKRTFAGSKYLNGYSDHLPVSIDLLLQ